MDIIAEPDYTVRPTAELVAEIAENVDMGIGATLFDTERIMGPVNELARRVASAEHERDDANIEASLEQANAAEAWKRTADLEALMALGVTVPPPSDERTAAELDRLTAVVAKLEAQPAAQQWRPVTEDWPPYHERVIVGHYGGTWSAFARRVRNDDGDDEWLVDDGRIFDYESAGVALIPLPLPPAPQEPTP